MDKPTKQQEESMFLKQGFTQEEIDSLSDDDIIKLLLLDMIAEKRRKLGVNDSNRRALIRRRKR